jgi:tRNA(Ile2) C34 agmatinyltransferase TiaS
MAAPVVTSNKKIYRMDVVCRCGGDAKLTGQLDSGHETIGYMCEKCHTFYNKRQAKVLNLQRKYLTR